MRQELSRSIVRCEEVVSEAVGIDPADMAVDIHNQKSPVVGRDVDNLPECSNIIGVRNDRDPLGWAEGFKKLRTSCEDQAAAQSPEG